MIKHGKVEGGGSVPYMNLQFGHEHDKILNAQGAEGAKWIRRIRIFGPYVVMVWAAITHKVIPSDDGLMVWGKKGTYRLGDLAMSVKPEWNNSVTVIMLQSSRQKAWLHGISFPVSFEVTRIDRTNMEQLGRGFD